jgi:hypothetical protein
MGVPGGIGSAVRELAGIGAVTSASVHAGTPELRSALEAFVGRAEGSLHVDLFRADDKLVIQSLVDRGDDLSVSVLADSVATRGRQAKRLRRLSDSWERFGADPLKQHGKTLSRDGGAEGIVATDVADGDAGRRVELFARFDGAPARALADVHAAEGTKALAAAIDRAAATGVVINDPRVGATHATTAVQLITNGAGPIRVLTKAFDSRALAKTLARRASTGPVELVTHHIPRAQRKLLRDAGVNVRVIDERDAERSGVALHGTLIHTDDHALLGSIYLEGRVLHGSKGRASREAGVLLGGDAAAQAARASDSIVDQLRRLD